MAANYLSILNKLEPKSLHHEVPVFWNKARGWTVYDENNKAYIDFTSGIFVANIGHTRKEILKVIAKQELLHSYVFPNEPRLKLVQKLIEISGMEKVFLCTTGSEAVEAALRCMWAHRDGKILGMVGANHGRTYGAKHSIERILSEDIHPSSLTQTPAGIIFESYLGYNAQFHSPEWVQEWCRWAKVNDIPVCFDEVQAGFGRTGKMFGYEHYKVIPDLIVVGKALSGSLPIAAVMGRASLLDAPDDLSSTHSGNPLCCVVALENLRILEIEKLVERSAAMQPILREALSGIQETYPHKVSKVLGRGMVWALDLNDVNLVNEIVDRCATKGLLLVKTNKGTIKIGPPLITPKEVLIKGCNIISEVLSV